MNRSVVTHHCTAWRRIHWATSRCTAGSVLRRWFGRGGKTVASATLPLVTASLPLRQPDQNAVGQHDGHGMPMQPWPQAALVLVPTARSLGRFMARRDRMPPLGQAGQLCQRGLHRQIAPELFPLLGLPLGGSLPQQPAVVALSITGHAPATDRDTLLAPPPLRPPPPATRPPLPAGHTLEQRVGPPHRGGRRTSHTDLEIGPHRHDIALLPGLQARQKVRVVSIVGIGHHTPMRYPHARAWSRRARATSGLVWKATSAGTRACCRRAGSCAQAFGRYNRTATGQVACGWLSQQVTAIWPWPTLPSVPEDGLATPTEVVPCLGKPVSSKTKTPSPGVASALIFATRCRFRSSASHCMLVRNSGNRCALVPGTAWAMVSPCLLGRSVSSPVVERSSASLPLGRQKRTRKAPKHSCHSGSSAGLACTSMGILLLSKRIPR